MEDNDDGYSVNSPRRVLSFSKTKKNQRAVERRSDIFSPSSVSGPKPSEVYGFVGIITTVVATVIFLAWAYVPESWLHSIGIYYYPNRYWALAMPTYGMVTVALALTFYIGLNFISTPSPTSLSTVFDEFTREADEDAQLELPHQQQAIKPISDIPVYVVNNLMFRDSTENISFRESNHLRKRFGDV